MNSGIYDIDKYLQILKNAAPNISDENENQLILSLQLALNREPDIFQQILESEIERRGTSAARNYIRMNRVNSESSIILIKKSIEILESDGSDEMWIDRGLLKFINLIQILLLKELKLDWVTEEESSLCIII